MRASLRSRLGRWLVPAVATLLAAVLAACGAALAGAPLPLSTGAAGSATPTRQLVRPAAVAPRAAPPTLRPPNPSPVARHATAGATPERPFAPVLAILPGMAVEVLWRAPGLLRPVPAGAVALTFDDGPDPRWTPGVLAVLARYHAHATFFDIGIHAAAYPALVRAEYAAGDGVANHTWTHEDLTRLPAGGMRAQIALTAQLLRDETGRLPMCLRPPYDAFDPAVAAVVASEHEAMLVYDVDPRDWTRPGAEQIAARVLAAIHPGAIVDLHDAGGDRSQTLAALPLILRGLAARHLTPVAMCR